MNGDIVVLMGGASREREISLISGRAVLTALQEAGFTAHAFDPSETPIWKLAEWRPAAAFNILHGGAGEDGTIQAALDLMGIPYTGSGVLASALAMDKLRTKWIWQANGLPTPHAFLVSRETPVEKVIERLGLPFIVKPVREGSSIGVAKVCRPEEFAPAVAAAAQSEGGSPQQVMAEAFVRGRELTVAILGQRALPIIEIEAPEGRYDYQNKYFTDCVRYHCPAALPPSLAEEIAQSALSAFAALGCRGWGRLDLILAEDGRYELLEMNTNPGMTGHSLVPMAARAAGLDFPALVQAILAEARHD
ncbi:MAG: D-alanine--D-alanine ligase [Rhodocyclaceae bacterium]|nr:D-alanine--D-alanine ligase [Rhodocyclaceae bacterium]